MANDAEQEIPVRLVQVYLCDPCLDGEGGECHTPGCSLWINRAPDLPLRDSPGVTILGADAVIVNREDLGAVIDRMVVDGAWAEDVRGRVREALGEADRG